MGDLLIPAVIVGGLIVGGLIVCYRRNWVYNTIMTKDVDFHYVACSTYPDYIEVWYNGHRIYIYKWIDGEDAFPGSKVGKIHAKYQAKEHKEIESLIS